MHRGEVDQVLRGRGEEEKPKTYLILRSKDDTENDRRIEVRTTGGQSVREVIKIKVDNVNVSDEEIDKQYSAYEGLPEGKGYKEGPQWDMDRILEETGEDVVIIVWAEPASQPMRDTRATEGAFLMISIDGKDAVQMKVKKGQRLEEVDGLSQTDEDNSRSEGGG